MAQRRFELNLYGIEIIKISHRQTLRRGLN